MELRKGIGKAWAGWLVLLWLAAAPAAVHAATVYNGFTGPFAPGAPNWAASNQLGSATMDSSAIVITGPGGGASLRESTDAMWYRGPVNTGVTNGPANITFNWELNANNSLESEAFVNVYDSSMTLVSQQTLGSAHLGGTASGSGSVYVPQFGYFVFGMNGMIYKGTAPTLNISSFVATIVPEASTWWAGGVLLAFGGWRYWRMKRKAAVTAANRGGAS